MYEMSPRYFWTHYEDFATEMLYGHVIVEFFQPALGLGFELGRAKLLDVMRCSCGLRSIRPPTSGQHPATPAKALRKIGESPEKAKHPEDDHSHRRRRFQDERLFDNTYLAKFRSQLVRSPCSGT